MSSSHVVSVSVPTKKKCMECYSDFYNLDFITLKCKHIICLSCVEKKYIVSDKVIIKCNKCLKSVDDDSKKTSSNSCKDGDIYKNFDIDFINVKQYSSLSQNYKSSDNFCDTNDMNYSQFI